MDFAYNNVLLVDLYAEEGKETGMGKRILQ